MTSTLKEKGEAVTVTSVNTTERATAIHVLQERDYPPVKVENLRKPNDRVGDHAVKFPSVAFIGRAGAGKTTGAEYLRREFGFVQCSFATLLKQIAHQIWGDGAQRDRSKLQPLGTLVRDIDPNAWVNALTRDLDKIVGPVVIDDCRFPNEYWPLKERGFTVIRVKAPEERRVDRLQSNGKFQSYEQLEHISETALDDQEPDYTIVNNTSLADFETEIWSVLNKELRRR